MTESHKITLESEVIEAAVRWQTQKPRSHLNWPESVVLWDAVAALLKDRAVKRG
jgi:hypothetical protein